MAARARHRIQALRRGPDGSAFQKCEHCGVLVAIALLDMHKCGHTNASKRRRVCTEGLGIQDQPRSPFCCFMESFKKTCKVKNWFEIDRRGFDTWKNMSRKERDLYVFQAKRVNSAHLKLLEEESSKMSEVDDEADSAMVGKFDLDYGDPLDFKVSLSRWKSKRWNGFDRYYSDTSDLWPVSDSWSSGYLSSEEEEEEEEEGQMLP